MLGLPPPDWGLVANHLAHLGFAFALALPLGWERGVDRSSAGLRTFPIVAMASCGYALLAVRLQGSDAESLTRLIQGLVAGIGFIGGGVILKHGGRVSGIATAASIWNTGAIGVAVAFDRIEIAIALAAVNFATILVMTPLARRHRPPPPGEDEEP
jgi:putative Mg2+ transporter-C (MgtC) family protein